MLKSLTTIAFIGASTLSMAAFTAYNDCSWATGTLIGNATGYNAGTGTSNNSGYLVDWTTGATLSARVALSWNGVSYNNTQSGSVNTGTDAYNVFNGYVNLNGVLAYATDYDNTWYVNMEFTGLDPSKSYEIVTTANRNSTSYTTRNTKFVISGADAFTNLSSSGTTIGDGGASTTFCTGYNTVNGYNARWTGIAVGSDGAFNLNTISVGKGYGPQAFMLVESVPEPSTILVLTVGGLALLRRRRK